MFTPLLVADEQGEYPANDWAKGFMRGMGLRGGAWASLMNDEEHGGSLVPIFALAHEHDPDPEMRPYKEPISAELRERLIVGAAAAVMNIYRYFRAQSTTSELSIRDSLTYRRSEPKVGRNEPCPCGSPELLSRKGEGCRRRREAELAGGGGERELANRLGLNYVKSAGLRACSRMYRR